MATQSANPKVTPQRQQALQVQYNAYKNTINGLSQKIADLETEHEEHKLVLDTLTPLAEGRKCYRMINGVLMERTVGEVLPGLKGNEEGLRKVIEELAGRYKSTVEEMETWKVSPWAQFLLIEDIK
jgi:prefoldin subunit 2